MLGIAADRIARPDGSLEPGVVWIDPTRGTIVSVSADRSALPPAVRGTPMRRVELGDRIVGPGCVDVHVHGGAGCQVNGDSAVDVEGALATIASFHARNGTSSLLATTVSDSPERLAAAVAGVAQAAARARATAVPTGARIIGSHLEGPFIAPTRAGAQDPSAIRPPDRAELNRLLELGAGTVRMVTLAPELPGADELIADCLDAGAVVALGHTEADFDTARRAFDAGATHVTHLFNCMPPLHHRLPGLITAALVDDRVTVELICDLHHVHPAVVEFVAQIALERLVLVTDAGPVAGSRPWSPPARTHGGGAHRVEGHPGHRPDDARRECPDHERGGAEFLDCGESPLGGGSGRRVGDARIDRRRRGIGAARPRPNRRGRTG